MISNHAGNLDVGLAGGGYRLAAAPTLDYRKVWFKPATVEVHYVGAPSEEEPIPVDGQEAAPSESTTVKSTDSSSSIAPNSWVAVPVDSELAPFELVSLGSSAQAPSFGHGSLPPGRYDQLRLTASDDALIYETATATGTYKLPSGRLYLTQAFEIRRGVETKLRFGFDVQKAMVTVAQGQKVLFKPSSVKVYASYHPLPEATGSP